MASSVSEARACCDDAPATCAGVSADGDHTKSSSTISTIHYKWKTKGTIPGIYILHRALAIGNLRPRRRFVSSEWV